MSSDTANFRDFTKKRPPIYFIIDEDRFDCHKALSAVDLQKALERFRDSKSDGSDVTADNVMQKILSALELLLKPDSFTKFHVALYDETREEPIGLDQLKDIFEWLIEQYTQRPTSPLADSSDSSKSVNGGMSSPDGVLPLEWTPSN